VPQRTRSSTGSRRSSCAGARTRAPSTSSSRSSPSSAGSTSSTGASVSSTPEHGGTTTPPSSARCSWGSRRASGSVEASAHSSPAIRCSSRPSSRPGASPRQTVRRQVAIFTPAFGVLLAVIVVGLVLTWRLMRREAEMAQLKSDFVANVSHDLKTPLSVIRMFGETLELGRLPDEARRQEYYRVITRESERLSRLIDNVLDFSRIEGGRRTYDMVTTAVEPRIRDTLEAFE